MSACRGLDVLMGAGAHGAAPALPAAAVVAAHIARRHRRSRGARSTGGDAGGSPARALAAHRGGRAAGARAARAARRPLRRGRRAGLVGAYAGVVGRAHADAARDPSPARLQRAVGAGILGLIPLRGRRCSAGRRARSRPAGAASAALWPVARRAARRSGA